MVLKWDYTLDVWFFLFCFENVTEASVAEINCFKFSFDNVFLSCTWGIHYLLHYMNFLVQYWKSPAFFSPQQHILVVLSNIIDIFDFHHNIHCLRKEIAIPKKPKKLPVIHGHGHGSHGPWPWPWLWSDSRDRDVTVTKKNWSRRALLLNNHTLVNWHH